MKNGSEALASQKEAISKQEAGLKSRFQIDLVGYYQFVIFRIQESVDDSSEIIEMT